MYLFIHLFWEGPGRAIDQVVSHRHSTPAAWFRNLDSLRGICGEQSGTGAGFLGVPRFPLPVLTLPTASH
jgi:hypothetical protein